MHGITGKKKAKYFVLLLVLSFPKLAKRGLEEQCPGAAQGRVVLADAVGVCWEPPALLRSWAPNSCLSSCTSSSS